MILWKAYLLAGVGGEENEILDEYYSHLPPLEDGDIIAVNDPEK